MYIYNGLTLAVYEVELATLIHPFTEYAFYYLCCGRRLMLRAVNNKHAAIHMCHRNMNLSTGICNDCCALSYPSNRILELQEAI